MNLNYKNLTFSWINTEKEKLSGIPKNRSIRRNSPYYRIFRNIEKEKSKRLASSEMLNDSISLPNFSTFTYNNKSNTISDYE